jgi:hypothetical protein
MTGAIFLSFTPKSLRPKSLFAAEPLTPSQLKAAAQERTELQLI